ncbi:transcriptional corepressor LEUNIG_HOMOLOG [Syzygium oleosum]|uniref:transcriptional corepressor LEUNIG_HOMOLOG n=1 Tax=Syzygium oleosum TaxID=219896 RepID=UPI0011D26DE9|nr:transcriptional corepressor LEUNIG_HOMOLOG [Syzygium oleosum]
MAQNQSNWEADKMLDVYIYDYLMKKKLHNTAKSFMTEGKVSPDPVAIDAPGGFLFEWWSVFWDIFIARTNEKHSEAAAAYIEAQQGKAREQQQQQLQMQQLHLMRQAQLQRSNSAQSSLGGPANSVNSEGMLGQPTASALAAKMYEERLKLSNPMDSQVSQPLLDARLALLKSTSSHPGQLVQGNSGSVTAALQQIQDIKGEVNMGGTPRSLPMNHSSIYSQGVMQPRPGIGNAGLNPGAGDLPLKGWPLTGIEQIRPGLGAQVQKPFLQSANQFQLLPQQQQQQLLAQVQTHGNINNSPIFGDMDPRVFRGLARGTLNAKEGQVVANDGSVGSPMQSTSSKMNMPQQSSSQQQQDPLQSQQMQQNNRKRKGLSSSGPANSTGTGTTVGAPNSQPSTPSTHTAGDGVSMASNVQQAGSMSKGLMTYGSNGLAGLTSSANQLDDIDHFGDVGSLDDNVESFLSHDAGDGRDVFGKLKQNAAEHAADSSKEFSFNEVSSIRKSNSKVVCCHFSSDGKYLASAGHDKKVILWNVETFQTESTPEEHTHIITDVRFRPNTTLLATSSFDTTIRVWDAAQPNFCVRSYTGHTSQVLSLDFHPKKNDLFCSCDSNSEIRLWSISQYSCTRVSKGGIAQVRFQPRTGHLLAAAANTVVSIFDFETDRLYHMLKGHQSELHSLSWDANGDYLASVCPDSVRVWRVSSGECVHELNSSGNKFHSCVFHPTYSNLLVIGCYQSLELWNMVENKCLTVAAHECVISALAQSPLTGMIASTSHDKSVKIWK